jgi:CHAT domain-containing protein
VWLISTAGAGYRALGRKEDALGEYQRAWELISNEDEDRVRWFAQSRLARAHQETGHLDTALILAEEAWTMISRKWSEWENTLSRSAYNYRAQFSADLLVDLYLQRQQAARAFEVDEQSRWLVSRERPSSWSPQVSVGELLLKMRARGERILIWAVTASATRVAIVDRLSSEHFDAWINRHRDMQEFRQRADEWGARLLTPFATELEENARLRIVADGRVRELPLAFLRWQGKWLIESHDVIRAAGAVKVKRETVPIAAGTTLWVSNAQPHAGAPALLVAAANVREFVEEFGGQRLSQPSDGDLAEHLATSRALVHLATHSGVDDYGVAYLELWKDGEYQRIRAPELLSWSFANTELVNLASCRSLGGGGGAAELTSLAVAVLGAGAQRVLGSLWDIPDRGAAQFMREFYLELFQGGRLRSGSATGARELNASAALQTVQRRWLADDDKGPPWWAGLIVLEQ